MAQATQTRLIKIEVSSKGSAELKAMAESLGLVSKNTKKTADAMSYLRGIANVSMFGVGIRELSQMSDSMQMLRDRLRLVADSSEDADARFEALKNMAARTKTSVESLSTIYVRLAQSTKDSGINSKQLLMVTEALQNSFRISGSTASEATAAAIQLSQGFASGQLRGQELRSVLEQNVVIGDLLTRSLGKTRGELYKLAEQGKLTSDKVLKVLIENSGNLSVQASKLSQTFGQTLTIALDQVSIKLEELNKKFGLSDKFASAVTVIVNNLDKLGVAIAAIATGKFLVWITGIVTAIRTAGVASLVNPWVAAFTALAVAVYAVYDNWDKLVLYFKRGGIYIELAMNAINDSFNNLSKKIAEITGRDAVLKGLSENTKIFAAERNRLNAELEKNAKGLQKLDEESKKAKDSQDGLATSTDNLKSTLVETGKYYKINQQYLKDGDVLRYADALREVNNELKEKEFEKGSKDLFYLNKKLREIQQLEIASSLNRGTISLAQFNQQIEELKIQELNEQLAQGTITLKEYDTALIAVSSKLQAGSAFRSGAQQYIQTIGTLGQQIAAATTNAFKGLEDGMTEFIQKGTQDWKKFAQMILDDITRIIVRTAVTAPLANAVSGVFSGMFSGGGGGGGVGGAGRASPKMFASGGVFDSPTPFNYGNNKLGVMGEAGPEAILPLSRSSNGSLGVSATVTPVTVNIVNNSQAEVSQKETTGPNGEKVLEVLIQSKVKAGIANGTFDKVMSQSFGVQRRGN